MSDPMLKLRVLARAETTLAQNRIQRGVKCTALFVVAVVFGLLALSLLNYSAFYALRPSQGPAIAALIVALANAGITVLLLLTARTIGLKDSEDKLAVEMRDMAYNELNRDVEQVRSEIAEMAEEVRSIHNCFRSLSDAACKTLTPLMGLLLRPGKKG